MTQEIAESVLLVDDDETFRRRLGRAFTARGYEVWEAVAAEGALEIAARESPEFAVVDLRMPGDSGLDVVTGLRQLDASTVVVVLTGYGSIATAVEAVRRGAAHYLTKPADADEILAAFARGRSDDGAPAPASPPQPVEVPSLARVEWEHINRILTDCGGNVSLAARLLGLHRRSLQRKLSKYPAPR